MTNSKKKFRKNNEIFCYSLEYIYLILNRFLIKKAKYYVVEPYYMEGSTPDGPVVFSGSLYLNCFSLNISKF